MGDDRATRLIPIYGCPHPDQAVSAWYDGDPPRYGATWPRWVCRCDMCGTPFVWCDAYWESGAHYTCAGCCGFPFCMCDSTHEGPCHPSEVWDCG